MNIIVAGTGYIDLSNAILLAQHNDAIALDAIQDKVDMTNNKKSLMNNREIGEYLATKNLHITATKDTDTA